MIRALRSSWLYFGLFYFRLGKQGISKWCFVSLCLIEILLISRYHSSQFFIVYALYSCFTFFFNGEIQKRSRKICGEGTFPPKYIFFRKNSFFLTLGFCQMLEVVLRLLKLFKVLILFAEILKTGGAKGWSYQTFTKSLENSTKISQPPPNPAQFWKACFLSKSLKLLKFLLLFQRQNQGNEEV